MNGRAVGGRQRLWLGQHPFRQSPLLNILGELVDDGLQLTVHLLKEIEDYEKIVFLKVQQ